MIILATPTTVQMMIVTELSFFTSTSVALLNSERTDFDKVFMVMILYWLAPMLGIDPSDHSLHGRVC